MKLKKEIQAIKELNEQEKAAQAAKAAQVRLGGCWWCWDWLFVMQVVQCDGQGQPPDSV